MGIESNRNPASAARRMSEDTAKIQDFFESKAYDNERRYNVAIDGLSLWLSCLKLFESDAEVAGDLAKRDELVQEQVQVMFVRNDLRLSDRDEVERVIREYSPKVREHYGKVEERYRQT